MKKMFIFTLVLFPVLLASCDFTRTKGLYGTNFELLDGVEPCVKLYYRMGYDDAKGIFNSDTIPFGRNDIKSVYWNKQYIIAYSVNQVADTVAAYYIVEQLPTDTMINGVPWATYHRGVPCTYQKYTDYDSFCQRLQQLDVDTTKMRHYKWKYVLGIY